jgi:hypothetical protein
MEPIISPWFIYFVGIVDPLKCALGFVSCVGFIALIIAFIAYCANDPRQGENCPEFKQELETNTRVALRCLRIALVVTVASFTLQTIIPSKQTMIGMAVANMVTVDNIQSANDFVKSNVQDYVNMIVEAVNKVR